MSVGQPAAADEPLPLWTANTSFQDCGRAFRAIAGVREAPHGSDRWWGTQLRHIAWASKLCGTVPGLGDSERYRLAAALGVPVQVLVDAAAAVSVSPGYRSRGTAVVTVLQALPASTAMTRLRFLLVAGQCADLWGAAYFWERGRATPRRWAFPAAGTRPP